VTDFAQSMSIIGSSGSAVDVRDNAVCVDLRDEFDQAVRDGRAFAFASTTYDPDAHDTILGVQNDSATHVLKIKRVVATSDTASLIQVFCASGVTMAGTAVTGVNLNRSSNRVAEATAKADETGNTEQASSYPAKILQQQVAANTPAVLEFDGAVSLPYGHMVGVDLTTAATAADVTIWGWFEPV
jgi:hypothetical protein